MSPFRNSSLLSLALGHFIVDFFSGALPIVIAALTSPLELTPGDVGLIALAYSFSTSLAQPLFGLIADSRFAPHLALAGVVWQVGLMGLAGLAGRFEVLLGLVALGGLGSAAFHPPGAGSVPRVTTREQRGFSMSVFLLGGNSGYAIGPLVAGTVLDKFTARGTVLMTIAAAIVLPVVALRLLRIRYAPDDPSYSEGGLSSTPAGAAPKIPVLPIVLLALAITFRGWAGQALNNYLPQYFLLLGSDLAAAGQASTLFNVGATIGAFASGVASDRLGVHKVIIVTLLLSGPVMLAMQFLSGPLRLAAIATTGMFLLASLPLTLVLGQEMLPGRPGVMSGLTLGFTFIAGGIGAAITGGLAERVGLASVFTWIPVLPLLGSVAALALTLAQRPTLRSMVRGGEDLGTAESAAERDM